MSHSPVRVLLVDDEENYRFLLEETLRQANMQFRLQWAPTYEAATEAIDLGDFDVAFVDYTLGVRDGVEVLRYAQEAGCGAPMIVLTGYESPTGDQEAMTAGAADYLSKDQIDPRTLARTIRYAIERNRIGEAFRDSEQRFRMLADSAPVLIWISDTEGHCTYFNRPWTNFTGRGIEELLGEGWTVDVHPEDLGACLDVFSGSFAARNSFRMEYRLRRFDGEYRWMLDTGVPLFGSDGEFSGYIGSCIDITERVAAKQKLIASERLTQSILHSLSAHIAVIDRDGRIMSANNAWRKFGEANGLEGLSGADVGVNYLEVCARAALAGSRDGAQALDGIRSVLDGEGEFTMEYACSAETDDREARPAQERWFLLSATALADYGGAVISHTDISERRNAERALEESQQIFRTFMDNSPAVAFMKDRDGRYVYVNKQFAKLFDAAETELVGKDDLDLYPEDVARKFDKVDDLVVSTGNTITAIDVLPHGGIDRFWLTVKFPVRDASGALLVGGKSIEISERIRAEKSLRESEERFQLASRATNDVIWDWDLVSDQISWNANVQALFRYEASEIQTASAWWHDRVHRDDYDRVVASLARALEGRTHVWSEEYRFRCGDGSYAYVLDRGYVLRDESGRAVRMIGAMTDLTKHKRAEDALRKSEAQYRRIVETAHEGIWVLDAEGRTTFVNRRLTEILGYDAEEMWGRPLYAFMDDDGRELARSYVGSHDPAPAQRDYRFLRKDGEPVWVILSTNPILDSDGSYAGALAMVTDITARRHAQEALQEAHDKLEMRVADRTAELRDAMERLESAHQFQQRFVADASHDLRTPLTVVRAELELLLKSGPFDDRTRDSLQRIANEAKRLDDLANDLLLLATLDAHAQVPSDIKLQVDDLLFDCVAQLRTLSAEKDIIWDVQVEEPVQLVCNGSMMERALMNILENAIKYSWPSSTVRVSLGRHRSGALVTVADRGVGIPQEDLPRIFDRFYRGDLTRNTEGSGLGLAIVKAVVDAHAGEVAVVSMPGEGTTVRVWLPAEPMLN